MEFTINGTTSEQLGVLVERVTISNSKFNVNEMDEFLSYLDPYRDECVEYVSKTIEIIYGAKIKIGEMRSFFNNIADLYHGKVVQISFSDDPDMIYIGRVNISKDFERSARIGKSTMTITAAPYRFGEEVTEELNKVTSKTINVSGNHTVPCVVEITPTSDLIDLTITGIARNKIKNTPETIIISNLKANKTIVIDGVEGTILQDGVNKFSETEIWEFPALLAGSNTITFSSALCNVSIKYKPRF